MHTNEASLLVSLKQVNNHTACILAANAMIYLIYQRKTQILTHIYKLKLDFVFSFFLTINRATMICQLISHQLNENTIF